MDIIKYYSLPNDAIETACSPLGKKLFQINNLYGCLYFLTSPICSVDDINLSKFAQIVTGNLFLF